MGLGHSLHGTVNLLGPSLQQRPAVSLCMHAQHCGEHGKQVQGASGLGIRTAHACRP